MSISSYDFDVIVVGGGHAGIEAAHAAARMGARTLLITIKLDRIGHMPCNPAIGGVGKGHIVFEISALGGLMPKLCTKTYLQARMLNTRKGPAVQGLRLQIDKHAYSSLAYEILTHHENLTIHVGTVETVLIDEHRKVYGIVANNGTTYTSHSVVITTGTFLNGRIHIGSTHYDGGRRDEQAVAGLSAFLVQAGLLLGRLKTGTPPRLLRSSLDFSQMTYQEPDNLTYLFEFHPHTVVNARACYITHTNEATHEIIRQNVHKSAMYSGAITGRGPRYCPSIEDKISRFPDKSSHHVFVEPEDLSEEEIYPNGISTSLPLDVQKAYVQTIPGFQEAIITKPGYAVEYDFVLPNQLDHTLAVKTVHGLFLAGQINGTTGYEEAAGQGIVAGINAACRALQKTPFIIKRTEGYIGVMIDDLVTMSVDEPYRMFTSRAEQRLSLRQDNAFTRLTKRAYDYSLVEERFYQDVRAEDEIIETSLAQLRAGTNNTELMRLLGSEACDLAIVKQHTNDTLSDRAARTIQAELLYEPYIAREKKEKEKLEQYQRLRIPEKMVYADMPGLSKELQQKLTTVRPATLAQASLIPGMTPAALSLLLFKIRRREKDSA
jgi:tRNA uridine 5-carboxymethylaminomethyl modification enzyme